MSIDVAHGYVWFVAFLFSTTVHEAMHALVAWKGGDPTAYLGGQVSLSPLPHIKREPVGMLLVPLVTSLTQGWAIGWASAPYDPDWAHRYPKRAAVMAAAGPAGNLLIAVTAFIAIKVGLANLLPLPPLDGSAVIGAALPARFATTLRELKSNGAMSIIGLLLAWQLFPMLTAPLFSLLLRLLYPSLSYS